MQELINDLSKYARRINEEPHPFHVKSDWDQPSVALETFPEEVKYQIKQAERPKDNLPKGERNALKELSRGRNIVLKKVDIKGATTIIMNRKVVMQQKLSYFL